MGKLKKDYNDQLRHTEDPSSVVFPNLKITGENYEV